ncbi:MAG TPA: hypothetical protein VMS93_08675 [Candidatus Saccharimonadales bacterium]|nr:hypothetical protein [Candidatus Saccharimonadales bacterium]
MTRAAGGPGLRAALGAGLLAALLAAAGCSRALQRIPIPNQPPQVHITEGEVLSSTPARVFSPYVVTFRWTGYDPDGMVDHYEYTTSAADTDLAQRTRWMSTHNSDVRLMYRADSAYAALDDSSRRVFTYTRAQGFFVRAVDQLGALSPWDVRMFNAYNIAPTTLIVTPLSSTTPLMVGPVTTLRWQGNDLDSNNPDHQPVRYHLFVQDVTDMLPLRDFRAVDRMLRFTVSSRGFYVGGDTTSQVLPLKVGRTFCAVVRAIDEAGAEEPLPTSQADPLGQTRIAAANAAHLGQNATLLSAMPSAAVPRLSVTAGAVTKAFVGYDPAALLPVQVLLGVNFAIAWQADASAYGGVVVGYRYALDIDDPTSQHPQVIRPGGFAWTTVDARATVFFLPPSSTAGLHNFYVAAVDEAEAVTIGVVQVELVAPTFDRSVMYVLDSPDLASGYGVGPMMTVEEDVAFWRDILERDRYWLKTLSGSATVCRPVAGSDTFIVNRNTSAAKRNIPLSVLLHYRVVVWNVPQGRLLAPEDYILHQFAASGGYNNLVAYLLSGGHVWGFGGGFGKALSAQAMPSYPIDAAHELADGELVFDVLGIRGSCTLVPTLNTHVNPASHPEQDPSLETILPYPIPFSRLTAHGRERTQVGALEFDVGRYDTLPSNRAVPNPPWSINNECLSGLPDEYNPGDPDTSAWQPVAIYRPRGQQAQASFTGLSTPVPLDSTVVGWYRRGSTLTLAASIVNAPFQLYYFGVDLGLMYREEVRQLADVVLSTHGWDIYRGGCPPARSAGRAARRAASR